MSAWVEVHVKGNRRAYINAGSVAGVIMPEGADGEVEATPKAPLMVIVQGGETLDGVFGMSAVGLIGRCDGAKAIMRSHNMESVLCRLDGEHVDALTLMLSGLLEARDGRAA